MKHVFAFSFLLVVSGCALTSAPQTALNFPHATAIRTACVVAITTNTGPSTLERGALSGVNDAAFVQGLVKNKPVMETISAQAYDDYLAGLGAWGEWTIIDTRKAAVPAELAAERKKRQQFADSHQKAFGFNTFVSHAGLIPFKFHPTVDMRQQELLELGRYAKLCRADAAIALYLNVGYEMDEGLAIGGFNLGGTAKAVVDHEILIADREGHEIAFTSASVESNGTVPMVSGAVTLDDTFTALVRETNKKAVTGFMKQFSAELESASLTSPSHRQ